MSDLTIDKSTRISMRISETLLDRIEALMPFIAEQPEYSQSGAVNRSDALRLALLLGVERLEQEALDKKK